MKNILKKYKSSDNQSDIFGDHYKYIEALHNKARKQYINLIPLALKMLFKRLVGKSLDFKTGDMKTLYVSIDPEQGRFLYNMVLTKKPNMIFEYGMSYGVSSMYLASGLKKNNKGILITTEVIEEKINEASEHFKNVDLINHIKVKSGDIRKTINTFSQKIDFVYMDGFPNLNLEVIKLLEPILSKNAVIITDDVYLFKKEMHDYLSYISNNDNYSSITLNISDGMLLSIYTS